MKMFSAIHRWEQSLHAGYDNLPDTPEGNRKADFYMRWLDHEVLRILWRNLFEIAPGIWRGNHPTLKGWQQLQAKGIKTVLNLRGESPKPYFQREQRICETLGLDLVTVPMSARAAPSRETLLQLIDALRTIEQPSFMHCKSGADRTGLAAAIYLMVVEGKPVAEARKMLSVRFLHLKSSRTGVLDAVLDAYEKIGGDFEDWVKQHYAAQEVQASFDASRRKSR